HHMVLDQPGPIPCPCPLLEDHHLLGPAQLFVSHLFSLIQFYQSSLCAANNSLINHLLIITWDSKIIQLHYTNLLSKRLHCNKSQLLIFIIYCLDWLNKPNNLFSVELCLMAAPS